MADEPEVAAAVGDPHVAFVTGVFVRFQRSLLRYLRNLLVRREDAEDVAQETYLRLVRAAPLDRSEVRVRAFMFKAATNLAYDRFRQRQSRGQHDDGELLALPDDTSAVERVVALEQALRVVERTVLGLPPRCRQVFLLRTSHECSYEEIAERLGVSKRTVEREMQTALDACQRKLRGGELP
ncbi:MAG TPA: RNA polymerase sigma factor [Gammaproteobacteria bacterium]|nr:RNA polymerase sigma factor [Gammaproteobacteria bacterium]